MDKGLIVCSPTNKTPRELKAARLGGAIKPLIGCPRKTLWWIMDAYNLAPSDLARELKFDIRQIRRWCSRSGDPDEVVGIEIRNLDAESCDIQIARRSARSRI